MASVNPTSLVSAFNTLPRNERLPSGVAASHFHFSVRHVPLTPPGHILFVFQSDSHYVHVEGPLPANFAEESTEVRGTAVALLLLKGFGGGLSGPKEGGIGRPWSWVCNDAELAGAVGESLKGLGVTAPEEVGIAEERENKLADEGWEGFFQKLRGSSGV